MVRGLQSSIVALSVFAIMASASLASAQSISQQDELHATVMAALLTDPRTATIPPAQLMALVNALSDQAEAQGISPQEIKWRGAVGETFMPGSYQIVDECSSPLPVLCTMSQSFGFLAYDAMTPAILFVTAGLLVLIIRRVIKHHRRMHEMQQAQGL